MEHFSKAPTSANLLLYSIMPKRVTSLRVHLIIAPGQHSSFERNIAAVASRWQLRVWFEAQTPETNASPLEQLAGHGHSLLLSSYLRRISRKENSACSACGHPLQDLNHLLDCPASEPLRKSIFGSSLYSRSMVQTLGCGPTVGSPRSSSAPPSFGKGRVVPPTTTTGRSNWTLSSANELDYFTTILA